jgi:hypothetical protein
MQIYAMGGFGCGNLGDDAIFQAMRLEYPNLIQIYVNKPYGESEYTRYRYWDKDTPSVTSLSYIWYSDLIDHGFPEDAEGGELILGGGGIFHSRSAVEALLLVALQAEKSRMRVSVRKVGMEYITSSFEDVTSEVLKKSYFTSVRSSRSKAMCQHLGFNCVVEKDYAYSLKDCFSVEPVEFPVFEDRRPLIGIVTAGNNDLSKLVWLLRSLTIGEWSEFPICNFIHIPHSRHYTDWNTNDVIGGEVLWSGINIYHGKRWVRYKQLQFTETVNKLLNAYTQVRGIIGFRYHSFIFSEMIDPPLFAVVDGGKAEGYFEDNKREKAVHLVGSSSEDDFRTELKKFFSSMGIKK